MTDERIEGFEAEQSRENYNDDEETERLEVVILKHMVPCAASSDFFLPANELRHLITVHAVERELRSENVPNYEQVARKVCRSTESLQEIFVILCLLRKAADVTSLIREGTTDRDLPFTNVENRLRSEKDPTMFVLNSENWKSVDRDFFLTVQWRVKVPHFKMSYRPEQILQHQELHPDCILPFTIPTTGLDPELETSKEGKSSIVRKVFIHPDHYNCAQRGLQTEMPDFFAVKCLKSMPSSKELDVYSNLNNRSHMHLTRLLTSFEYQGCFNLVFPWANSNLQEYWMSNQGMVSNDREVQLWISEQVLGLADALRTIHDSNAHPQLEGSHHRVSGYHGDIKPEKILWFQDSHSFPGSRGMGMLKIGGFGLAASTGSVWRNNFVGLSDTHEALELGTMNRVSAQYDLLSFGCLLLEFAVWCMYGRQRVITFRETQTKELVAAGDGFFRTRVADNYRLIVECKASVSDMMTKLIQDELCSEFLLDLVECVESGLLCVEPKKRFDSVTLTKRLQMLFVRCQQEETYCTRGPVRADRSSDALQALGLNKHHDESAPQMQRVNYQDGSYSQMLNHTVSVTLRALEWILGVSWSDQSRVLPKTTKATTQRDLLGYPDDVIQLYDRVQESLQSAIEDSSGWAAPDPDLVLQLYNLIANLEHWKTSLEWLAMGPDTLATGSDTKAGIAKFLGVVEDRNDVLAYTIYSNLSTILQSLRALRRISETSFLTKRIIQFRIGHHADGAPDQASIIKKLGLLTQSLAFQLEPLQTMKEDINNTVRIGELTRPILKPETLPAEEGTIGLQEVDVAESPKRHSNPHSSTVAVTPPRISVSRASSIEESGNFNQPRPWTVLSGKSLPLTIEDYSEKTEIIYLQETGVADLELGEELRKCAITHADDPYTRSFWPADLLYEILTEKRIQQELDTFASIFPEHFDIKNSSLLASRIKQTHRKLFALLCLLSKGACIKQCIKEGVSDDDLPLLVGRRSDHSLCRRNMPERHIQCFKQSNLPGITWQPHDRECISENQHRITSVVFDLDQNGHVRHMNFDHEVILPFMKPKTSHFTKIGGFTIVDPVEVHPYSHRFHDILPSIETKNLFALKRLNTQLRKPEIEHKLDFDKEVAMLKRFSGFKHPHLVTLLVSWTRSRDQNREFCFLFPLARCDLDLYWTEHSFNQTALPWISEQVLGLTDALDSIHNPPSDGLIPSKDRQYDRHGDLKPENILWYDSPRNKYGVLVIADLGASAVNSLWSRSAVENKAIQHTTRYQPPECDLEGGKISRSHDIWTFGCILLELVCWCLEGNQGRVGFGEERMAKYLTGSKTDMFFDIKPARNGKLVVSVKQGVTEQIAKLHRHPNCTLYFHELLFLIEEDMIITVSESRNRITSSRLYEHINGMHDRVGRDVDYHQKPCPLPREPKRFDPVEAVF